MKNKARTSACLSITEKAIKFARVISSGGLKAEIASLEVFPLADKTEKTLNQGIGSILRGKRQANLGKFILLIPRQLAALHYVRLPSTRLDEISGMAKLQAAKQIPYDPQEIILGYQILRNTPEGYSDVILVIVHQDIIKKYLRLMEENMLHPEEISIDSQGICAWLKLQEWPKDKFPVMILDLDCGCARLDILAAETFVYSRAFALNAVSPGEYKTRLREEINRSLLAYHKESGGPKPQSLIFTGAQECLSSIDDDFVNSFGLEAVKTSQDKNTTGKNSPMNTSARLETYSFASLIGAATPHCKASFNLLPDDIVAKKRKTTHQHEIRKACIMSFLIIGVIIAGAFLNILIRKKIIEQFKNDLRSLSGEVGRIEKMSQKALFLKNRSRQPNSPLEVLVGICRITNERINLASLNYNVNKTLILKGQAQDLLEVFNLVGDMEDSPIFMNVQTKRSTRRKIQGKEIVDFELICQMEKK